MGKRRGRRPAKWETANTLSAAIERLYEAFRFYPLRPEIDYCTHCITAEKAQRIYARPLRLWPDLETVASKLDYACWRGWPKTEQQAIEDVLMTALLESLP